MSLVEYGVFCEASSVVILAGGVFLHPLPSPAFVLSGGWVQKCGFEWVESGCVWCVKCLRLVGLLGGGYCLWAGYVWASVWCVYVVQGTLREYILGGVVGSIESVFFLCGWELSVVILVCLAVGAVWRWGVTVAVPCLLLLLDSCLVVFSPSSYSCSGSFFRTPIILFRVLGLLML